MFCNLKRFCIFAMSKRDKKTIKNNQQVKNQQVMNTIEIITKRIEEQKELLKIAKDIQFLQEAFEEREKYSFEVDLINSKTKCQIFNDETLFNYWGLSSESFVHVLEMHEISFNAPHPFKSEILKIKKVYNNIKKIMKTEDGSMKIYEIIKIGN